MGKVPRETWARLDEADLKECRATLPTGLDRKPETLFLNRGFAFQARAAR